MFRLALICGGRGERQRADEKIIGFFLFSPFVLQPVLGSGLNY
jgi:hypothetical protein